MKDVIAGSENVSIPVRIIDAVTGQVVTTITHESAGLAIYAWRENEPLISVAPQELLSEFAEHVDGGIVHVADGLYRVCYPDDVFATGVRGVICNVAADGVIGIPCNVLLSLGIDVKLDAMIEPVDGPGPANLWAEIVGLDTIALTWHPQAYRFTSGLGAVVTEVLVPPAPEPKANGWVICYDINMDPVEGVDLIIHQIRGPGDDGNTYAGIEFTITSVSNGVAQHAGHVRGGTYKIRRGTGKEYEYEVPDAATFPLPEQVGRP